MGGYAKVVNERFCYISITEAVLNGIKMYILTDGCFLALLDSLIALIRCREPYKNLWDQKAWKAQKDHFLSTQTHLDQPEGRFWCFGDIETEKINIVNDLIES